MEYGHVTQLSAYGCASSAFVFGLYIMLHEADCSDQFAADGVCMET
jgi:hypothetical protein